LRENCSKLYLEVSNILRTLSIRNVFFSKTGTERNRATLGPVRLETKQWTHRVFQEITDFYRPVWWSSIVLEDDHVHGPLLQVWHEELLQHIEPRYGPELTVSAAKRNKGP
jgi:hypothetical protein